uniref:Uncharacterized protein n=1 Tax=Amphimedon queenslandica TaxID=400682 RepID=A0A1X7SGB6_AMPQE
KKKIKLKKIKKIPAALEKIGKNSKNQK